MSANVSIIGAGITGPTAALALAHAGHNVTVYEQRPDNGLHSNGLLGVTERNWAMLKAHDVDLSREILNRTYRDYELGVIQSPFRWIIWTDLHNAITAAAKDAGARFVFNTRADAATLPAEYMIDAGGVVSAARRRLENYYLGQTLYRGTSPLLTTEPFTTYKMPNKVGFLDIGRTFDNRSWWVLGIRRPAPAHHGTTFTNQVPPEIDSCPEEFRAVVKATKEVMVLPQYIWTAPSTMHDASWSRFTLGDANGSVRALTTSGANLGVQGGFMTPLLITDNRHVIETLTAAELHRRAFALHLGITLRGPEIGATLEDPDFAHNQSVLYGGAR